MERVVSIRTIRRRNNFNEHKIKPNQKTNIPHNIFVLDTEAYIYKNNEYEIQKLRLGWVFFFKYGHKNRHELYFTRKEQFYEFLIKFRVNKRKFYIFAHNFDYDAQILDLLNISKYMNGEITNFVIDGRNFIIKFTHKWTENNKNKQCTYIFVSTTNYFKVPLRKIGKMLNLEKGEVNFTEGNEDELKAYCYRDTEILEALVKYFIQFIKEHDLGNFRLTIASQAFGAYRHRFMKYAIYIHNNKEAIDMEIKAYKGGRSEAFRLGNLSHFAPIYKLDINSMYPYVMKKYMYPTKLIKVIHNASINALKHYLKTNLVIADIEFYISKPAVGIKMYRLIFPIGYMEGCFTNPELELILKYGKIIKVNKIAIYDKAYIFRDYVNELYALRKKFKEEGNDVMQFFVKILLNSLYGKFGQKVEELKLTAENINEDNHISRYYDADLHTWKYVVILNNKKYEKGDIIISDNAFIAIPAFVTAYARTYLWELIEKGGIENVYYCDTDSLFTNEKGYKNLKGYIDNKKLGMLKVEDITDKLIINNVKDYKFGDEVKLKGIKKNAEQINDTTYKQKQFIKIRGNLTKYNIDGVIVLSVIKHLNRTYKKGNVDLNGVVHPYEFKDIEQFRAKIPNYDDYIQKVKLDYINEKDKEFMEYIYSDLYDLEAYWDDTLTIHENIENIKSLYREYKYLE